MTSCSVVIPSGKAGAGDATAVTGSNGWIRLTAAVPAPLRRRCSDSFRRLELLQGIEELDGILR